MSKAKEAELEIQLTKLNVLYSGGVDNWEWYGEVLKNTDADDALSVLTALENGGVDNWEWYGECLSDYFDWVDYINNCLEKNEEWLKYFDWLDSLDEINESSKDIKETVKETVEESVEEFVEIRKLIRIHNADVSEEVLNNLYVDFVKNKMDWGIQPYVQKSVKKYGNFNSHSQLIEIRKIYVNMLYKKGILEELIKNNI